MEIEYYYSIASPFAYLGSLRFQAIVKKYNLKVIEKPLDLVGKVFPETGGLPVPKRSIQRQNYRLLEIERFGKSLNIKINSKPKFFPPKDPHLPAKFVIAAILRGNILTVGHECLKALWCDEMDISDIATLKKISNKINLEIDFNKELQNEKINSIYVKNTTEAISKGVFGAPTYIFNNEIFWGQDRLDLLEAKINKKI